MKKMTAMTRPVTPPGAIALRSQMQATLRELPSFVATNLKRLTTAVAFITETLLTLHVAPAHGRAKLQK
jgi:hypothetical protein